MDNKPAKVYKKRLLLFALVVISAFIFWSSVELQDVFFKAVDFFEKFARERIVLGILIFVGLAVLSAMLSPFSSIPLIPVAVIVFGVPATIVLLLVGWLIGDSLAYFIGCYARYLIPEGFLGVVESYKNKIYSRSQFEFVLLFRLALPAEITGYTLGVVRYNFGKYLLASFLAELPFSLLAVYSSEALVKKEPIIFIGLIVLAAAIVILFSRLYKK